MVDQLTTSEVCRQCGAPLSHHTGLEAVCSACGTTAESDASPASPALDDASSPGTGQPDPDNPSWGPISGISVWFLSVVAIVIIPVVAVLLWYVFQMARGAAVPNFAARDELLEWLKSPTLLLVQVLSTIVAHGITIAICWAVVTRAGKRPFLQSLGWNLGGHSVWYWLVYSACVIVALQIATQLIARVLPQSEENSFTELLKSSTQVRIAIAILATCTAPLVEETVYRGVLFSSLRRNLGIQATVVLVTVMFTGVHVLQYLGAWVSIAGLTLLSLVLTVIRARTRSILPCVLIHTVSNAFSSVFILINRGS